VKYSCVDRCTKCKIGQTFYRLTWDDCVIPCVMFRTFYFGGIDFVFFCTYIIVVGLLVHFA
jgi:hypothetical protein